MVRTHSPQGPEGGKVAAACETKGGGCKHLDECVPQSAARVRVWCSAQTYRTKWDAGRKSGGGGGEIKSGEGGFENPTQPQKACHRTLRE
ncbi:hypothetical protein IE53DRAFT_390433 [Violaceomyces palustris]|uniref:Uncharacterized protein n=1 Tax=Violaceomyces palustris TaxID=1673888 RepID=A0ACD0NNU6_9BASI|nr:hypothetical protein IE53DRAFT_390433 [Violaceomyces palustris]